MAGNPMTAEGGIYPSGFSLNTHWPWPLVKSKNLVLLNYGKALRDRDRRPGSIPVYGTNGQCGWHDEPLVDGPGVILGRKGQGHLGVEWCDSGFWVIDTAYYVTRRTDQIDLRYFYYLVKYIGLNHLKDGTSNPSLSRDTFAELLLPQPPIAIQRAISIVLSTLDDKIELNRRMNETLEAMAQALCQSWFVDFDPVHAKAEGRDTTLPKDIDDLFPDCFEDSELGEIPTGWRFAPLPEAIEVNPSRALRKGTLAPYLDMANMPTRGHTPDAVIDRPFGSGMRFMNGDTLVARITPCLENGKTAYVDFLGDGQVGWGSTEYIVLRPKPPLPNEFAYCLARSAEFREFAIQSMTGSSGRQRVPAESLMHFLVVSPSQPIAELFGTLIRPLFARAASAIEESRTLAALRDTLLPKLISGELRIEDAERFLMERRL